jgi:hypothetical protein
VASDVLVLLLSFQASRGSVSGPWKPTKCFFLACRVSVALRVRLPFPGIGYRTNVESSASGPRIETGAGNTQPQCMSP